MRATNVVFLLGLLCCQVSQALQMILSTSDPYCKIVTPNLIGGEIDIHYTVTGVKEANTEFYVSLP